MARIPANWCGVGDGLVPLYLIEYSVACCVVNVRNVCYSKVVANTLDR